MGGSTAIGTVRHQSVGLLVSLSKEDANPLFMVVNERKLSLTKDSCGYGNG